MVEEKTLQSLLYLPGAIGRPAGFFGKNHTSVGMKFIRGLSDNIDATVEINSCNGTRILLGFRCDAAVYISRTADEEITSAF